MTYNRNGQTITATHVALGVFLVNINGGPTIPMDRDQLRALVAILSADAACPVCTITPPVNVVGDVLPHSTPAGSPCGYSESATLCIHGWTTDDAGDCPACVSLEAKQAKALRAGEAGR
jgi:hypothetical protein